MERFALAYFFLLQVLCEIIHSYVLKFLSYICVDIHRRAYILVSKYALNHFQIHSGLTHTRRECVSEYVTAEPRQQHRHIIAFMILQNLVIAVTHDPPERLVYHAEIQDLAELVTEYEVLISVDYAGAVETFLLLIAFFLKERLLD